MNSQFSLDADEQGNKGGVAIRMRIQDTTLCFVNSHLCAHTEEWMRRNQVMMMVVAMMSEVMMMMMMTVGRRLLAC